MSKICCEEKHVDLLLIPEKGEKHFVFLIPKHCDFNMFMYNYTLHCGRKHFCRYCLQAFSTEEILKRHIKNCFKINDKQRAVMPKKVNSLD